MFTTVPIKLIIKRIFALLADVGLETITLEMDKY